MDPVALQIYWIPGLLLRNVTVGSVQKSHLLNSLSFPGTNLLFLDKNDICRYFQIVSAYFRCQEY